MFLCICLVYVGNVPSDIVAPHCVDNTTESEYIHNSYIHSCLCTLHAKQNILGVKICKTNKKSYVQLKFLISAEAKKKTFNASRYT